MGTAILRNCLKIPITRIFFSVKILAYHMQKPVLIEEKFQNTEHSVFSGPKVLLFCLKSVPWTGNELAGDDEENCENSQLTLTNPLISCNFVSVSLEILLKSCPITISTLS